MTFLISQESVNECSLPVTKVLYVKVMVYCFI